MRDAIKERQMKTSELTGRALNWAVAMCLGWKWKSEDGKIILARPINNKMQTLGLAYFHASKSWSVAGPIIERERISIQNVEGLYWQATHPEVYNDQQAKAPLIAAMRCFVASRWLDEVELPEELK